jgi:hypothetical protein
MNRRLAGIATLGAVVATVSFGLGAATVRRRTFVPSTPADPRERAERVKRIRQMGMNEARLGEFIAKHRRATRTRLMQDGHLLPTAPAQGTKLIAERYRTGRGELLLQQAKDVLFSLLFGDESMSIAFQRTERELLTLTVPRAKVNALEFMKASTELTGAGTWQDPDDVSSDERADNVIIEVEYGEMPCEMIGDGIATALRLINALEVNEQILYGRMTNIEQSTLVD